MPAGSMLNNAALKELLSKKMGGPAAKHLLQRQPGPTPDQSHAYGRVFFVFAYCKFTEN
jgi:hypothetical protein